MKADWGFNMTIRNLKVTKTVLIGTLLLCGFMIDAQIIEASQILGEKLAEGQDLLDKKKYRKAIRAFESANRLAEGEAEEPLLGLAKAHYGLRNHQKVIDLTEDLLPHAVKKRTLINANNLLGISLYAHKNRNAEMLEQAEQAFRKVIDLVNDEASSFAPRYSLAMVLRDMQREREAADILRAILEDESDSESEILTSARISLCSLRSSLAGFSQDSQEKHERPVVEYAAEGQEEPIYIDSSVKPPAALFSPNPHYPAEARRDRIQGIVVMQLIVDKMGCVTNPVVLKGISSELDRAAVETISRWTYKPATVAGEPVAIY